MRPFLDEGSWIGIEWFRPGFSEKPRTGDLVLCRTSAGEWILHRIVGKSGGRWVVKGDAALISETYSPEEIWGRAGAIRTKGRTRPFRVTALDRWIARLSAGGLRRAAAGLAWLRRRL